jgi:hypothetical protein
VEFVTMGEIAVAHTPSYIRCLIERWRMEYAWLLRA